MKNIFMCVFGAIGKGVWKCFSTVSGWCFLTIQKIGVHVGYILCFMLFGIGAAGVFASDLPLNLLSMGLSLLVARIIGSFCWLLGGFVFAHVVNADARIQAQQIMKKEEEFTRKLKEEQDKVSGLEKNVAERDEKISSLNKTISEKEALIFKASRTINLAAVKEVLQLFLLEAEMTIYDFDNDKDMGGRELKIEESTFDPRRLGRSRFRSQWQYIGFREDRIKAIFGVDLNDLHLEKRRDPSSNEDVLYVYGVRATHAIEQYTPMHKFSMMRKITLQECQMDRNDDAYKMRLANMEVFETKDGKAWEVVKAKGEEYTCSEENQELKNAVARQDKRMLDIHNGIDRKQYKALDDQVIRRASEFLKIFLSPICKRIEISISDVKPTDWNRIETLPRLQEFCEDYNKSQVRCLDGV